MEMHIRPSTRRSRLHTDAITLILEVVTKGNLKSTNLFYNWLRLHTATRSLRFQSLRFQSFEGRETILVRYIVARPLGQQVVSKFIVLHC